MDGFSWDFLLTAVVTLFVVVDPLGVIPIFASITAGTSFGYRLKMAIRGCLIAFAILGGFAIVGADVLERIGISMAAFRTAGGILLFLIGLEMLFERRTRRRSRYAELAMADYELHHLDDPRPEDISVFPLALPLLAGPGAMASIVLLMGENEGAFTSQATVLMALAIVMLLSFALLILSVRIIDRAGESISTIITRIMGMLLTALSVQYVFDGVAEALRQGQL